MLKLKSILLLNGASTTLAGVILLILSGTIAMLFGVAATDYFIATGIFFTLFGIYVFYQSRQKGISKGSVKLITIIDWLWVLISIALVILLYGSITALGVGLIIAIAVWVAVMALLEGKYM